MTARRGCGGIAERDRQPVDVVELAEQFRGGGEFGMDARQASLKQRP